MQTEKIIVSNKNGQRELEGQELEDFLTDRAKMQAEVKAIEAEAEAKAQAKAALLERLGITADEAKLLLS